MAGLYVTGWIKRGPSGVIGTNKPDAVETVGAMLRDLRSDCQLTPSQDSEGLPALLGERGVRFVTYEDWQCLDRQEIERGEAQDRPRVKFTSADDVWNALV